jgi:hypothetical protein
MNQARKRSESEWKVKSNMDFNQQAKAIITINSAPVFMHYIHGIRLITRWLWVVILPEPTLFPSI